MRLVFTLPFIVATVLAVPSSGIADDAGRSTGVTLALVQVRTGATADVLLRLRNGTVSPIYYSGYGPLGPHYTTARKTWHGWSDDGIVWCGTGASWQELGAGDTIEFAVEMPDDEREKFRIGLRIFRSEKPSYVDEDDEGELVWSEGIERGAR